jgi:hypothetical protein
LPDDICATDGAAVNKMRAEAKATAVKDRAVRGVTSDVMMAFPFEVFLFCHPTFCRPRGLGAFDTVAELSTRLKACRFPS